MQLIRSKLDYEGNETTTTISPVPRMALRSLRAIRELLTTAACRLYGIEGRDWRIVQTAGQLIPLSAQCNDSLDCVMVR